MSNMEEHSEADELSPFLQGEDAKRPATVVSYRDQLVSECISTSLVSEMR